MESWEVGMQTIYLWKFKADLWELKGSKVEAGMLWTNLFKADLWKFKGSKVEVGMKTIYLWTNLFKAGLWKFKADLWILSWPLKIQSWPLDSKLTFEKSNPKNAKHSKLKRFRIQSWPLKLQRFKGRRFSPAISVWIKADLWAFKADLWIQSWLWKVEPKNCETFKTQEV